MTVDVYEKAYSDAREILFLRGKRVGAPAYGEDGLRYCPVDGLSWTDRQILRDAWGDSLADEILRELEQHNSNTPAPYCPECDRLWRLYTGATKRYVTIVRQAHTATIREDTKALIELDVLQHHAAQTQLNVRKAIRLHATAHKPSTSQVAA